MCDNKLEPGEHYAEQNKPSTEKYCMISLICAISCLLRGEGWKEMEMLIKMCRDSVMWDE